MCQHIGQAIINIESTLSTNNYATSQVRENEVKAGTVFLAYDQTAGRGQLENKWESEAGKNLTFSIFLKPTFLDIRKQFMLSKAVCLGMEKCLSKLVEGVHIKWPNDIYVGDQKICGILIENAIMNGRISQSIVGIGLNVNQSRFLSDAPNPVSLKMISGKDYQLEELLTDLLKEIDFFHCLLEEGNFDELDQQFLKKLYRREEWYSFKDENHQYIGKIVGVNKIGQLRIQEKNGLIHEYHFKEVTYL